MVDSAPALPKEPVGWPGGGRWLAGGREWRPPTQIWLAMGPGGPLSIPLAMLEGQRCRPKAEGVGAPVHPSRRDM